MTKAQWKAIYDYCNENCYENPYELLKDLKNNGTVSRNTTLEDLAFYADDNSYNAMYEFLEGKND